jgi:SAM-dependent methyltransferase
VLEIDRLWQGSDRKNQQTLAAHVPMLLHPRPRRVLVVGAGTGQTASRFLMHDVERLDCVDIEPAVFDMVRDYFDSAWMDDERVRLIREDGRNYLAHTRERYDVISIEVGQISRPGVPLFYTAEFYQRARQRLRPGGFLSQFVPTPFFTPEQFRAVLATFLEAFPQSFLWYNRSELLVIGANAAELRLDGARLELLSQEGPVGRDLRFEFWGGPQHSLHQRTVFLASFLTGPRGLAALAAGAPLYRDDRPVLDYATSDVPREETREIPIAALLRGHLDPVEDVIHLALGAAERTGIQEVREKNLGDLAAHALLRRASVLSATLSADEAVELLERAVQQNPDNFAANLWLAESLAQRGRFDEARRYYAHALDLRAQDPRASRGLRMVLRRLGRAD